MGEMLSYGQTVQSDSSGMNYEVQDFLGGGGQGEVYRVNMGGVSMALKWYFPHWLEQDTGLLGRLKKAVESGPPTDRFLWPLELVFSKNPNEFGYVMPLREPRFKGIMDLMKGRVDPTFRALATAGFELAHSYLQLHAKGLCYRDISFGNAFFDPNSGEIRICDNDNVDIDGQPGAVGGTPDWMAPEIVRCEALPSRHTDLFSLAVLLFYIFHIHHPLQGKKMLDIKCWDLPARKKIFGSEAVFIFDPADKSNEATAADPEAGATAIRYWSVYPQFLRDCFVKAFTSGLRDPENGRVVETEWRAAMVRLRDSIIYCPHCAKENFYCIDSVKASGGAAPHCISCYKQIQLPPRIRIGKSTIVMLNHDTKLYPHHIDDQKMYDFSKPIAEVTQNPKNPSLWGIKNISDDKWVISTEGGTVKDVEPQRTVSLAVGTKISFGKKDGEIRL